jgi:hypothetical protein
MAAGRSVRIALRAVVVTAVGGLAFAVGVPSVLASPMAAPGPALPSLTDLPTVTLTIDPPKFSINPTALDFGEVAIGSSKSLDAVLTNSGAMANFMDYSGGTPNSTAFTFEMKDNCLTKQFYFGQVCVIRYTFTPSSAGVVNAQSALTVAYSSAGQNPPRFIIALTGCGSGPGAPCLAPSTASPSATKRPGSGGQPAAQPTATAVPVVGQSTLAAPQNTAIVSAANSSGQGTNVGLVMLAAVAAAILSSGITVLMVFRGRQIWSMLTRRT